VAAVTHNADTTDSHQIEIQERIQNANRTHFMIQNANRTHFMIQNANRTHFMIQNANRTHFMIQNNFRNTNIFKTLNS